MMPPLHHEIFHKALSSDIRREVLISLSKKDKYLSEISNEIDKKPQTLDFHLRLLEEVGLVESKWQEGKKYYSLKDKRILEFLKEGSAIPPHLRHKAPHEIVIDAMKTIAKRLDSIEEKIDRLQKK
jgi:DNA-binding transcriptional ArsR family regulator